MADLPRGVRVGYGLGSVATGAFGTVPGLLPLPHLTDTIGIGAAVAGVVVFSPKAWDVVLNPLAGRISDRHVSPRGARRPFLLRAGVALAACFALLLAGPPLGAAAPGTAYVVVLFLACATAYTFLQVLFVATPADGLTPADRVAAAGWYVQPQMSSGGPPPTLHLTLSAALDPAALSDEDFDGLLAAAGTTPDDGLPDRVAEVSTLLDLALPVAP